MAFGTFFSQANKAKQTANHYKATTWRMEDELVARRARLALNGIGCFSHGRQWMEISDKCHCPNTSDCKRALGRALQNLDTANRSTGFCH